MVSKTSPFLTVAFLLLVFAASPVAAGYFQQEVNHRIHVTLDDENHLLNAAINTQYINNSPDTLSELYFHLWPNAYSGNQTAFARQKLENGDRDFYFATEEERVFIDSLDFRINQNPVVWGFHPEHPDIAILYLEEFLLPGDTIFISTPFRVGFPHAHFSRIGHNGQAYYASQWYPKPAVYDQKGWHAMPYLHYGEFYSEFGSVDVFLTLPENYVVASTGEVMNPSERQWLDSLASKYGNKEPEELPDRLEFPESASRKKTIHLRQENVHEFAWFADKRFYVRKRSMLLPHSQSLVETWAFFHKNASQWTRANTFLNDALYFFSFYLGDYPWETKSALQGPPSAPSMEYPAVTLIGNTPSAFDLERALVHETGHNWFYAVLASNERLHPWMDEGLTQYYEKRYFSIKYPDYKLVGKLASTDIADFFHLSEVPHRTYYELWYLFKARRNLDQPIGLPAHEYTTINYFGMTYFKAALAFYYLEQYLGREVFDRIMAEYAIRWSFKHPYPDDLQEVFEEISGKNLDWFFKDLILTNRKINYQAVEVKPGSGQEQDQLLFTVKNKGGLSVPFPVSGMKNGEEIKTIWYEGFDGSRELRFPSGSYDALMIDARAVVPEIDRSNNRIRISGIFRKIPLLELQPLGSIENPQKTQIVFAPVVGWNDYNGFMPGMAFYNYLFPSRPTEWLIMPMYATANDGLTGKAWLYHSFFPQNSRLQYFKTGASVQRFSHLPGLQGWFYNRLESSIEARFLPPFPRSSLNRSLKLRNVLISRDVFSFDGQEMVPERKRYYVNELSFSWNNRLPFNSYSFNTSIQQGNGFVKAFGEGRFFFDYGRPPGGFSVRLFAGAFISGPGDDRGADFRFRLSGHRGSHDYLFDHAHFARNEPIGSFWGNMIREKDGGFKFPTPVGQTGEWLTALNLKADIPNLPFNIYFDAGTYQGASGAFFGSQRIPWVAGLQVSLFQNMVEVNFPLRTSSDLQNVADLSLDNYWQRVTFSIYLERLNPFDILKDLQFVVQ